MMGQNEYYAKGVSWLTYWIKPKLIIRAGQRSGLVGFGPKWANPNQTEKETSDPFPPVYTFGLGGWRVGWVDGLVDTDLDKKK